MEHVYKEKTLQLAAIGWLSEHKGYAELAGDVEATGDRMDSIGLLEGVVIAVEVKPAVYGGMTRFRDDRSGSLEAKIAATIGGLIRGVQDRQLEIIRKHWLPSEPPEIAILAGHYTDSGLAELKAMLEERGTGWCFNSRIWRWDGLQVETLFRFDRARVPGDWQQVSVPAMVGMQRRRPAPSMDEFRQIAEQSGYGDTFEAFLHHAREGNYRVSRLISCVNIRGPAKSGLVISVFLDGIYGDKGINAGVDAARIERAKGEDMPGEWAPRMGYMNTNRYFRSPEDVAHLFARIRPA